MASLELQIEGVEPALSVRRFSIHEGLSELFSVSVVVCSPRVDLDLEELLFKPASFCIAAGWAFVEGLGRRVLTGLCESIEQLKAEPSGLSTYSIRLLPRLWLLTLRTNYRIFQHRTIPDIVTCLLDEHAVQHTWRIDREAHPKLDYKVQYGETDYAFVSRLCEEAGITFAFQSDEADQSVVVFNDAPCSVQARSAPLAYVDNPNQAAEKEFVTAVRHFRRGQPEVVALRDYDFRNPSLPLLAHAAGAETAKSLLEQQHYQPGAFRLVTDAQTSTPIADKLGAARHEPSYGKRHAENGLLGIRSGGHGVAFETNALDLTPGAVFSMSQHPHPKLDERHKLLVTHFNLEGEHDKEWTARGKAVFADQPYRPTRKTSKPVVHGLQSAVVTGPPGREIFTDEYGRVRVQFPWDREGNGDELSSCWIRTSQGWAGAGFGLHALPRVGQEVLVGFLAGDPDEPVIVGRALNAHNPPPYALPANETKTVWRSRSTPDGDGYNEISFEDTKGEELLYERAQRNKETIVRADEQLAVGGRRSKLVKGDEHAAVIGERRQLVARDDNLTVLGNLRESVEGSRSLIIKGDLHIQIGGRLLIESGGEIHLDSGTQVVASGPDISLNAGGFVHASGAGVEIDGAAVLLDAGGAPSTGAPSRPIPAQRPNLAKGLIATPGGLRTKLPMFPLGPIVTGGPFAPTPERDIICRAICGCDGANNGNRSVAQWCVTLALWEYDKMHGGQSTIKAEVPFDVTTTPARPIMSKNEPDRSTHSKPGGTEIPDVVVLYDGTKPPDPSNIRTIYEIKMNGEAEDHYQNERYRSINRGAGFEVLRPKNCNCDDGERERLPHPIKAKDAAKIVLLVLLALMLLAGRRPDAAEPLIARLLSRFPALLPALLEWLDQLPGLTPPPNYIPR